MNINLADYVGKCVTITLRNGTMEDGVVRFDEEAKFHSYQINDQDYTQDGYWNIPENVSPMDIIAIEEYVIPKERFCESCKFYEDGYCDFPNTTASEKRNAGDAFVEIVATVDDDQGLMASLKVGSKFGCIQHKGVWQ